jgi:hypothetical protein
MLHTVFSVGQRLWVVAQHVVMSCECHDHTRIYRSSRGCPTPQRDILLQRVRHTQNHRWVHVPWCRNCACVIDMRPTGVGRPDIKSGRHRRYRLSAANTCRDGVSCQWRARMR